MIERFRSRFAMPLVNLVETLFKQHLFSPLHGLWDQVCLDPDAVLALTFCRAATADAALRAFTLLGDAAKRQPLADPTGDGGPGALGIDAAFARFSE